MWMELLVMDMKVAYVTANKFIMALNYVLGIDLMLKSYANVSLVDQAPQLTKLRCVTNRQGV